MADQAITDLDKNGDGNLSAEEYAAAPGLAYCADQVDSNGDASISRDEIAARITLYEEMRSGLSSFICSVRMNGRPLPDAEIRLEPEPFMKDLVEPGVGKTYPDGQAQVSIEKTKIPGVRVGMYRVKITSAHAAIPAKYNSETTLGVEVSPVTDPNRAGPPVFNVTSH